jgi:MMP 1-O-methyltransferase
MSSKQRAWPSELRDVKEIEGWLALDGALLLYELARLVSSGCIVEVGSYRGRSTVALARGSAAGSNVPVYAVEPHEEFVGVLGGVFGPEDRAAFFQTMLRTGAYRQVRLVNLSSEVLSGGWTVPVALLWLDGDHAYQSVRRDFDAWAPHLTAGCDLVLDDAADPELGPFRLAEELGSQGWERVRLVGRVLHLRRPS